MRLTDDEIREALKELSKRGINVFEIEKGMCFNCFMMPYDEVYAICGSEVVFIGTKSSCLSWALRGCTQILKGVKMTEKKSELSL